MRRILALTLALAGLAFGAQPSSGQTVGGFQFTDWTSTGGTMATGTLLGRSVMLSGWRLSDLPASYLDGTSRLFAGPYFTPPLPQSDAIEFRAENVQPHDYTLQLGGPTTDPVLDLGSLGTTLQFPPGTSITRISGKDDGFAVSGSTVSGAGNNQVDEYGENDSNGTVRLNGTFSSITFTASTAYALDGIALQVGAAQPLPPPPASPPPPAPAPPPPPPSPTVNVFVTGIEVTQGIQASACNCTGTLPSRDQSHTSTPGQAAYQGARMAAAHFTVVRVFAGVGGLRGTPVTGATARLEVLDSFGRRISLLTPDSGPARLPRPGLRPGCVFCVRLQDRADPNGSFNFLVPWQETLHRTLSFRATVSPPVGPGLPVQCATCQANTFLLTSVPFVSTAAVPVHPIPLTTSKLATNQSETQVFGTAQTVLPVDLQIFRYDAPLPVDGMDSTQASAAVAKRASDDRLDGTQYPIGVFVDGTPNLGGSTQVGKVLYGAAPPVSIVRDRSRPLTSVMHEIGHGLGLPHADTGSFVPGTPPTFTGPHPDGSPDCGGNSSGQVGEVWPPDDKGRIQGVGFDRRDWDIFRTGSLPRTVVEGFPNAGDEYYDFMSYCGGGTAAQLEASHWLSMRNWNRLLDFHAPPQALAAAVHARARAAGTQLRVIATVDAAGHASVFDVAPGQRTAAQPTAGTPYRIELRDAAGNLVQSVVPAANIVHVDDEPPGMLLEATVPASASAAAAVVSAAGREVARRARTSHAPTASIVAPRPGSRVGGARTTLVRWTAHDADGDRLAATVDYSADGGRHWKVVADAVRGTSARVASGMLSASDNARLRVRVSDGFDVATATSGRLRAAGAPPRVRIVGAGGRRLRANATLLLRGDAFDDAGRKLTGARLRWYVGKRLTARGELVTLRGLPAGAQRIRLVATDARGRSSQASLRVEVAAIRPTFLVAHAPNHVAANARHVRMTVASTVPATLRIAGARYRLDRTPRAITIAIRPGRSTLHLTYSLSAAGGVTRGTYVAKR